MSTGWSVKEPAFRLHQAKAYEGLFTLGSGYMHVRGSLEEHLSGAPQNTAYTRTPADVTSEVFADTPLKWGTFVPGIFGRHPLLNSELINLPWFLGIAPIVDGERLDVAISDLEGHSRTLDLKTATLRRRVRWRTRSGKQVVIEFERFVDAVHPHLCVQRMRLLPGAEVDLTLRCGLDADVRTNGYDHLVDVKLVPASGYGIDCRLRTDAGDDVHLATRIYKTQHAWRWEERSRSADLVADFTAAGGQEVIVEKRTAVATSRDLASRSADVYLAEVGDAAYEELSNAHAQEWARRWQRCDVVIEGDDDAQQAMRVSLFHLLRAHVPDDPRVAIDPKGYAGEAYWGRYFWDTELFLLPFYLYTDPARARTLVDFRVGTLDGARANASRYGYGGARYAWESDADGNECCPNWQYADHEIHVTADVVYGLQHYAEAVDEAYLRGPAATVVVETARYWLERLDRPAGQEHFSLLGVMGPDEYTPISNNNSYTNVMVSSALRLAAEIGDAGGAGAEEQERFAEAADLLRPLRAGDGELVLQCEGFDSLADPRFDLLWQDRARSFGAQVSQERLYRSKCLKQADVLMLMMLFPTDYTDQEVRRAWDYYLPYTTHDSSLSAGVHAIVAARLRLADDAWRFWVAGSRIDLDLERGGAAEGIHIANAGAVWQMALLGFAGLRTALQSKVLTLDPQLPSTWSRLAFPIIWKGTPVRVDITRACVTVRNLGSRPLTVRVGDDERSVDAQLPETWPREQQSGGS